MFSAWAVNEFSAKQEQSQIPMTIYRDPEHPVVRHCHSGSDIDTERKRVERLVVVKFPLIPELVEASGICRFYLKSVHRPFWPLCVPDEHRSCKSLFASVDSS